MTRASEQVYNLILSKQAYEDIIKTLQTAEDGSLTIENSEIEDEGPGSQYVCLVYPALREVMIAQMKSEIAKIVEQLETFSVRMVDESFAL